jgi:hypothetical protein
MPRIIMSNSTSIHTARAFLGGNRPYTSNGNTAELEFHPRWAHVDPFGLSILAAWGSWCKSQNYPIVAKNIGHHANYAARMKLFQQLGIDYKSMVVEHEEAGRFLPLTQIKNHAQLTSVIANVSALLHLQSEPDALAAVQYCVSELIRNVLEHSESPDGAFVCAHRYVGKGPKRVTMAVADCGTGIATHLGRVYPEALKDSKIALGLAMRPGITGAVRGMYGTPENAGAGLFITRSIAKGTGGYFLLVSDDAAYRLLRSRTEEDNVQLLLEGFDEPRHNFWRLPSKWIGTTVAVEIRTDKIEDFQGFFQWIRNQMPSRKKIAKQIRFT